MKIAIICFPGVSYTDILTFLEPLQLIKDQQPDLQVEWDFCSYLPIPNGKPGFSLTASVVGLPLQGFDLLYLPDPNLSQDFPQSTEWQQWIGTAEKTSYIYTLKRGSEFYQRVKPQTGKPDTKRISFNNGYQAGLQIVELVSNDNIAAGIQNLLNLNDGKILTSPSRTAKVKRTSAETQIEVNLQLDGVGKADIKTGIPFLDHMLNQIAKHGLFDLLIIAQGDLEIDPHHTMEDCALALGEAFRLAAGDRKGIQRMASATIAMDESLAEITLDFSGRPYTVLKTQWSDETLAEIPTSLFEHFLESFASAARINLFVRVLAGKDNHHMSEAIFKALARALDKALMIDERRKEMIPSTKEVLF